MINETLLRLIVQEKVNGKLKGSVLTLGRQNVQISLEDTIKIIQDEGVVIDHKVIEEIQVAEKDRDTRYADGTYVSDKQLFALLGITNVHALDVTDYENAEVIHNLNFPIAKNLENQYDYIIDGGTFDHLFDIKTAFENITQMLKDNGTLLMWNGASNFTGAAYISYAPDFFWDYFIENKFTDVRVYLAELRRQAQNNNYMFYKYLGASKFEGHSDTFFSPFLQMTVVMATKSKDTTIGVVPIQSFYRPSDREQTFDAKKQKMLSNMTVADIKVKNSTIFFKLWSFVIVNLYTFKHRRINKVFKFLGLI